MSSESSNSHPPAWIRWWKPFIVYMSVVMFMMATMYALTTAQYISEPLTLDRLSIENSPVHAGEPLMLKGAFRRYKLCMVDVDQFIFREPEHVLVRRDRMPSGMAGTDEWVTVLVPTEMLGPRWPALVPGKYLLRIFIHSDCGYRLYTYQSPDVSFEIIP